MPPPRPCETLAGIRRILMAILCLGTMGTAAELLLLGHYEDAWQVIPLVAIGLGVAVLAWHALARRRASVRALRLVMLLFVATGGVGVVLHSRGSREFQLEVDPSLHGWKLFWKVIQAKAPPTLAPAILVQLGLVGLAYAFRHPAASHRTMNATSTGA